MSLNLLLERLASKKITLGVADTELSVKAPQGAMDADTLAMIRQYKQALIALLSSEQVPEALQHADGRAPRITPEMLPLVVLSQAEIDLIALSVTHGTANIQDIYPLAPLQEGILFHHLLESKGDAYLIRSILAFDERARLDAFLAALQQVIDRHDILRSSIRWEGLSQPVQVVCRRAPLPVETIELDGGASALAQLQAFTDPRHLRLDLQRAPLLGAYIGRDPASGEWLLALLNHHIVSDHMTLEFIIAEIGELLRGRGDSLPVALPYRNFIAQVHSVSEAEHEAYFRRQLGAIDEPSAMFGLLNVQHDGSRIDEVKLALDSVLAQRIRDSARGQGMSTAVLFHVAWSLVVARCSGSDDVVFGTVLSGRLQGSDGAGHVLGMFLNTLPIRITQAGLSVRQVVHNTHQAMSELLAHEQAPLALAQRCSGVSAPMPLFTSLLNYRHSKSSADTPGKAGAAMAWSGIRIIAAEERTNYPVTVSVDDLGTAFALTAQCAQGIDPARIATYLHEAASVLVQALEHNPDQQFDALSILPVAEQRQLIDEFNDTERAYSGPRLVHQLFEAQCARNPDAIAVRFNQDQLSYDQLNRRANHLAHQLLALGVQPGDRVAICSERSADMIAGLLGILKAGCAYVPLDPAYPRERLAYMLDNSAPVALLTQAALRVSLPFADAGALPVLLLEPGEAHADDGNPDAVALGLRADQLAYIIYTSGSTGQPKGVAVTHEPVTNVIEWVNTRFCVDQNDILLLTTSLCFDLSVYDIFGTLAAGACVRIASELDITDPRRMLHILCHEEITFWDSAPAVFGQLLPFLHEFTVPAGNARLRLAFFSGDWIPLDLPVKLRQTFTQCQVVSLGGATEATVWSNFFPIDHVDPKWTSIPYGRPIQNARYYVLDRHLLPCPIGVAGDLYIGGSCLSAGYFNKPALTAERFVHDPFHRRGARMYKTGDRALYWEDGNLQFLGRNDFQVKIRGFRVELGEIESRLLACDGVREAVVVARADVHGDKRLVAYVIGMDDAIPDAALLRATLAQSLADYMLPSAFVTLASFPLTLNGKLDRQALPAPDQSAVIMRQFIAPAGDIERVLADIWQEMLELPDIGRHDHFFELGGHSLLAVRLVSRLRQQLGVEVALRDLFAHPTLCALATIVQQAHRANEPAIPCADREQPLPLSWAQQRLWFLDQFDHAAGAAYHMAAGLRLDGALDHAALQATLDRMVARHESLRTSFPSNAGAPVQHIAQAGCGFALRNEDLRALDQEQQQQAVAALGAASASAPFDLANGPLIRGSLLRLADQVHILLLTQHHIITDGWSIGILVREVSTLYAAFSQGLPDPLPALAIQYADYAAWQRQWLQGDALQAQIAFWRTALAGAPALIELPLDRPRPAVQSYAGASVAVQIAPELAASLRRLAQQHGCTVFMVLLAGWASLLARLSGQTDVVVGTPVANRQRSEVEGVIGFFVNTLAVRVRFEDNPSVADLLAQVRTCTLAAYSHQDLPFEQVVEAVQPPRSLSHSPLFQVMLSLNNTPGGPPLRLPGLHLTPLDAEANTTQFDLSLTLSDTDDFIGGSLRYAVDLFDHGSIERMASQLVCILGAMAADERQSIAALPMLDAQQRHQLLFEFNNTECAFPRDLLLHQLFENQVMRSPDAEALRHEGRILSYAELNRRANRVAHRLIALGVRPDDRVALGMERGADMVIGLLGILKAGGAYVPLDPAYPAERLAYMLDDCAPRVLLTQKSLKQSWRMPHAEDLLPTCLLLDDEAGFAAQAQHNPCALATPRHLAYVIYTSGSTGQPKGVMIEHANAVNFVCWATAAFSRQALADTLFSTSINFDLHVFELFAPLACGARIELVGNVLTGAHGVALINTVPSAIRALLAAGQLPANAASINLAGEPLRRALAEQIFACPQVQHLANLYGPSETTTYSTWVRMHRDDGFVAHIGKPIANTQVYILDTRMQPVALGVVGELYIGGAGVARGYLNRAQLTTERFIPDPFHAQPGARLYRTGDLGRWLASGNIEYLGRNDFQVKIRGFRIELGEIENALLTHTGLSAALVLARETAHGDKRLVAYVAGHASSEQLRAHLAKTLPDFMIPALFVVLDALPTTPNGKIDHKSLPEADLAQDLDPYSAPRNALERTLSAIWQDVLQVERVGVHDNFFHLGGHSLLLIEVIAAAQKRGLSLSARQVFLAPTVAQLAQTMDNEAPVAPFVCAPNRIPAHCSHITPEMLTLIDLGTEDIAAVVAQIPGGAANIQDIYPLAPMQEGILFHSMMSTAGDPSILPSLFKICGRHRLEQFVQALQLVVARHDVLRTAILWESLAQPLQVVCRQAALRVNWIQAVTGQDAETAMHARCTDSGQRMDLRQAPLLKLTVCAEPASDEFFLILQLHHIVADHEAIGIIQRELSMFLSDPATTLPAPPAYRAFVAHAQYQARHHDARTYFSAVLGDVAEPTAPFGLLNVQGDGSRIVEARAVVPKDVGRALRSLAKSGNMSPAAMFHAAWALVLSATSGRADVVFGTVLSGRLQGTTGAAEFVGPMTNVLPLRLDLRQASALSLVNASQAALINLLPYEQASLALAQRCSNLEEGAPLFTSMLNYRHSSSAQGGASQLPIELLVGQERTNYPFYVAVDDMGSDFVIDVQIDKLISAQRMLGYMQNALAQLVQRLQDTPNAPIATLSILPDAERLALLDAATGNQIAYPRDKCMHELFELQVARTPDAIALEFEGKKLSYAQLNARANQVAHLLVAQHHVEADSLVGLCTERSLETIIAILGIMKSGAAYVPLDPAYPAVRLAFMLEDAQLATVLTHSTVRAKLPIDDAHVICLDQCDWHTLARENIVLRERGAQPHHLAYVIYTSGSTGDPKGVMINHASLVNLALAVKAHYRLEVHDRFLQFATINFDMSVEDIFSTFASGACLVLRSDAWLESPARFWQHCAAAGVTVLDLPTAYWHELASDADSGPPPCVRHVSIGGEQVNRAQIVAWYKKDHTNQVRLLNTYGPTECTVDATFADLVEGYSGIGKPLPNASMYILDRHNGLCPAGVAGELHIGGICLARGYLRRPALTAEKFIGNPFHDGDDAVSSARLYKTGDLVRATADGSLEYLGRIDQQVKIRGFRVELGEVEARLAACAGVHATLAMVREDRPGEQRLVAYLVARDGMTLDPTVLRAELATVLADYMLPSALVQLESFPMTPNGKLDRRALPAPDQAAQPARALTPPVGQTEMAVAEIWRDLLGVQHVARDDNFFDLGGHSLLAVRLAARLRQAFGRDVTLRELFAQPSLAQCAATLDKLPASHAQSNLVPFRAEGSLRPLFMIHPGGGEPAYVQSLLPWLDPALPVYGLGASGFAQGETALTTIEAMAALYVQAIRCVQGEGPYRVVGWSTGGKIAYEMAYQLRSAGLAVEFVGIIDTHHDAAPIAADATEQFDPVNTMMKWVSSDVPASVRTTMSALAQARNLGAMLACAKDAGLILPEIDEDQLLRFLAVHHAIYVAESVYLAPPLAHPVCLFAAGEKTPQSAADCAYDPSLGWHRLLGTHLDLVTVGGNHFTMIDMPHARGLGAAISTALREAGSSRGDAG